MPKLVQPDPITLSANQVRHLLHAKFSNSFKERRLAIVRDIVIAGCITGLRYSDLMALNWENLARSEGKTWLTVRSQKTGIQTKLLVPDILVGIIRRYRKLRRQRNFPQISNVNLNIQIKNLGKWMGWDAPTQVLKSQGGHQKIERTEKFYEVLTTHTMRRTCITLMLQHGMPEHLVRQISGHAPNSKEFYRYVKIAQDWQDKETDRVHNELLGLG
jgi:integrase